MVLISSAPRKIYQLVNIVPPAVIPRIYPASGMFFSLIDNMNKKKIVIIFLIVFLLYFWTYNILRYSYQLPGYSPPLGEVSELPVAKIAHFVDIPCHTLSAPDMQGHWQKENDCVPLGPPGKQTFVKFTKISLKTTDHQQFSDKDCKVPKGGPKRDVPNEMCQTSSVVGNEGYTITARAAGSQGPLRTQAWQKKNIKKKYKDCRGN